MGDVLKVVGEDQLEAATSSGWELESQERADEIVTLHSQQAVAVSDPFVSCKTVSMSKPVAIQAVARRLRFIVRKSEDSVLAAKDERIVELEKAYADLQDRRREAELTATKAIDDVNAMQVNLDTCHNDYVRVMKESETLRVRIRQMEADLAKVRTEVGAERIRSILGR